MIFKYYLCLDKGIVVGLDLCIVLIMGLSFSIGFGMGLDMCMVFVLLIEFGYELEYRVWVLAMLWV